MKCLEKERSRRYETANGLARDLERYLSGETVLACPPSAAYRFRKFARRNKAALVVGVGIVAALLTVIISLATSNRVISAALEEKNDALRKREQALAAARASASEAEASAAEAEASASDAQRQRDRAEESFRKARAIVARTVVGPALGLGQWSGLPPQMRIIFANEAVEYYETLVQVASTDPDMQYETAVGYRSIGFMFQRQPMKDDVRAEELVRKSIAILEPLVQQHPENQQYRQQLGWSNWVLTMTLQQTERLAEAEEHAARAAEIYERLVEEDPANLDFCIELITVYARLGELLRNAGRLEEAADAFRRSAGAYEGRVVEGDNPPPRWTLAINNQWQLTCVLLTMGRPQEAVVESRKVIDWSPENSERWMWSAAICLQAGDPAAYRRVSREMLDHFRDSADPQHIERTAKNGAVAPGGADDPLELVALADRALEGNETHPAYWYFIMAKGLAEFRAGHFAQAVHWLQRTMPTVFRAYPADATIYSVLAMSHHQLGQHDEARSMLEGARTILDGRYPPDPDGATPLEGDDVNWMHAQILYREAVATLAQTAPTADETAETQ
jgi:tetratricopeptide (TPR) repeat protein